MNSNKIGLPVMIGCGGLIVAAIALTMMISDDETLEFNNMGRTQEEAE